MNDDKLQIFDFGYLVVYDSPTNPQHDFDFLSLSLFSYIFNINQFTLKYFNRWEINQIFMKFFDFQFELE
jgi:hypothetical protein